MPTEPVISVRDLTKQYMVSRARATTLKELVVRNLSLAARREPFLALEGVTFDLAPGRSLAVIGGNGSGKSTLLKIICGITEPTRGTVEVRGRVAALLELGAAFQPEFSGMENIFLQCAVFGLDRPAILARLDSIIDFAELDQFIHTPVKHYSSGMFVRLAFAIALHVDANVIVLDEALAVGDTTFQVKCQRRLAEAKAAGCSLIFVTHVPDQVEALADEVLWLDAGRVKAHGPARAMLSRYYLEAAREEASEAMAATRDQRLGMAMARGRLTTDMARVRQFRFLDAQGREAFDFPVGAPITAQMEVEILRPLPDGLRAMIGFGTTDAVRVMLPDSRDLFTVDTPGVYTIEAVIDDHHLRSDLYIVTVMLCSRLGIDHFYDYHVREYAVSVSDPATSVRLNEARLRPWGVFSAE